MNDKDNYKTKNNSNSTVPLRNLRILKELRNWSYEDISKKTPSKWDRVYIYRTLTGKVNPGAELKIELAELFQVEPLNVEWGVEDDIGDCNEGNEERDESDSAFKEVGE